MLRRCLLVPSFLLGVFAACGDDPLIDPPATGDAGSNDAASNDATSDDPSPIDSSSPVDGGDADADVATDSGPVGAVTVLAGSRRSGSLVPTPGLVALFHDTTGAVLRATTGADGRATAMVHAGASVTVLESDDSSTELTTVLEVGLGETIEVVDEPTGRVPTSRLKFTGEPPSGLADGTEFRFYTGQGGSGGHFTPNVYTTETDYPLVDGMGFRFVGFAPIANVLPSAATKYAVGVIAKNPDGGTTEGTVVTADWADTVNAPLSLTGGAPANATAWTWDLGQANGAAYYPMLHSEGAAGSASIAAGYARVPASLLADVYTEGAFTFGSTMSRSVHIRRAANAGTIVEDLASYLPPITAVAIAGTSAKPSVTITTAAPLGSEATGHHRILGARTTSDGSPANTNWVIVHRASGAAASLVVVLPELPADLAAGIVPQTWTLSTATLFVSPQLTYETNRTQVRAHQRRVQGQPSRAFYPKSVFDSRHVRFTN